MEWSGVEHVYTMSEFVRVAGVASKVSGLVALGAAGRLGAGALRDALQWESRTLTSALKAFLRALPDPLLTRRLHDQFIARASQYSLPTYLPTVLATLYLTHLALPVRVRVRCRVRARGGARAGRGGAGARAAGAAPRDAAARAGASAQVCIRSRTYLPTLIKVK